MKFEYCLAELYAAKVIFSLRLTKYNVPKLRHFSPIKLIDIPCFIETAAGKCGKVKYTVNHILFPKQVKHLVKKGILVLPSVCAKESQETEVTEERIAEEEEEGEGSDEDADLFVNRNRRGGQVSSSSSSSSEEESEEEEAEEEEVEEGIKSEETRALEDTAGVKS